MFDRVLNMSLELSVPNITNGRSLDKAEKLKTFPFLGCLRMREAGGGEEQKGPLPKNCHTYPTIMKLGTVKPYSEKYVDIMTQPLSSADISIFYPEIRNFC